MLTHCPSWPLFALDLSLVSLALSASFLAKKKQEDYRLAPLGQWTGGLTLCPVPDLPRPCLTRPHAVQRMASLLAILRSQSLERVQLLGQWRSMTSSCSCYLALHVEDTPCVALGVPPPFRDFVGFPSAALSSSIFVAPSVGARCWLSFLLPCPMVYGGAQLVPIV